MRANFNPEQKEMKYIGKFKFFCIQNFPFIADDFDQMTYYELLCKVVEYLKKVIKNTDNIIYNQEEVLKAFNLLQDYVNNYFDNLDVQEEIDNKLDEMAETGVLQELLTEQYEELRKEVNQEIVNLQTKTNIRLNDLSGRITNNTNNITTLDTKLVLENTNRINADNNLQAQINSLTNGAPIPVSNINQMTNTNKIYLLTTDGYWYYYNGSEWTRGGIYQASNSVHDNLTPLILGKNNSYNAMYDNFVYFDFVNMVIYFPNDSVIIAKNHYYQLTNANNLTVIEIPNNVGSSSIKMYYDITNSTFLFKKYNEYVSDDYLLIAVIRYSSQSYYSVEIDCPYAINDKFYNIPNYTNELASLLMGSSNRGVLSLDTTNKTFTVPADTVIIKKNGTVIAFNQALNPTLTCSYSSISSSAIKFIYSSANNSILAKKYDYKNASDDYTIALFRNLPNSNIYSLTTTAPYEIDGKPYNIEDVSSSNYIDYDKIMTSVNHRGFNSIAPENTLPAFKLSRQNGFKFVETDIRFTSDNIPVLLHDASINRTARNTDGTEISQTINIADITYNQALTYDFGIWKSSVYADTKIPSFDQFISLCKNLGLTPYLEIKVTLTNETFNILLNILKKYDFVDKVVWISFTYSSLETIKNNLDSATIGYLSNAVYINSEVIQNVNLLKTSKNKVFVDTESTITSEQITLLKNNNLPLEVWTVDNEQTILSLDSYVTGVTSNSKIAGKIIYNNNI